MLFLYLFLSVTILSFHQPVYCLDGEVAILTKRLLAYMHSEKVSIIRGVCIHAGGESMLTLCDATARCRVQITK